MDRRGWNLALGFQEVFTAVVRLRYNRQAVQDAEAFRAQMRQALRVAEQEARSRGCSPEDVKQVIFAVVAFLDESVLSSGNPVFANWPRLPLQAELFGNQLAGEIFFQELQKTLSRNDSQETADLLEVYYLCLLLGFKGRYAAGGDLRSIMGGDSGEDPASAGPGGSAVSAWRDSSGRGAPGAIGSLEQRAGKNRDHHRGLAVVLFVVFKVLLMSGASSLSALVGRTLKTGGWDVVLGDHSGAAHLSGAGLASGPVAAAARLGRLDTAWRAWRCWELSERRSRIFICTKLRRRKKPPAKRTRSARRRPTIWMRWCAKQFAG